MRQDSIKSGTFIYYSGMYGYIIDIDHDSEVFFILFCNDDIVKCTLSSFENIWQRIYTVDEDTIIQKELRQKYLLAKLDNLD